MKRSPLKVSQLIGGCLMLAGFSVLGWQQTHMALRQPPESLQAPRTPRQLSAPQRTPCKVLQIYDGDTLGCDFNGDGRVEHPTEHVRLLGIDAPEMHYSIKNKNGRKPGQNDPFAAEAKRFLETQTLKRTIWLEADIKPRDRYGRVLAYAYLQPHAAAQAHRVQTSPDASTKLSTAPSTDLSINQQLLARGLAQVLFIRENRRDEPQFKATQAQAKAQHLGIWALLKNQ